MFKFHKLFLTIFHPLKTFRFLDIYEEMDGLIARARQKSGQGIQPLGHLMNLFYRCRASHINYLLDLVMIRLYPPVCQHETRKLTNLHPESALVWVKPHVKFSY